MGAYKLEAFNSIDPSVNELEKMRSEILDRERNEAYARGFKDGVGVTRDAVDSERNRVLTTISDAVASFQVTQDAASEEVFRGVVPLIHAVLERLAPTVARDAFSEHLHGAIQRAATRAATGSLVVRLSPDNAKLLSEDGSGDPAEIKVVIDAAMGLDQAMIEWDAGFDRIDISASTEAVLAELESFIPQPSEANHDGS